MIEKGKHLVLSVICHVTWTGFSISSLIIICLFTIACSSISYPDYDEDRGRLIVDKMIKSIDSIETFLNDTSISKINLYDSRTIDTLELAEKEKYPGKLKIGDVLYDAPGYFFDNQQEYIETMSECRNYHFELITIRPMILYDKIQQKYYYFIRCRLFFYEGRCLATISFIYHENEWYFWGG
jgi:hypothetical protein